MRLFFHRARAVFMALSVHVIFAVVMLYGLSWTGFRQPTRPEIMPAIQAKLIDVDELVRNKRDREQAAAREAARQRRLEEQRRAAELEQQRQREAALERQRQQEAQERQERADEALRLAEQQRVAREKAAAEEKARQEEMAAIQREIELAEAKRKELEERVKKQEADARERQARELAAAEERERERIAALEAAELASAENATLRDEYIATIRAVVSSNWLKPPSARVGLECQVVVQQIPGGEVVDARVTSPCNADEATRRSIVQAVRRSEPLPNRGFEKVFESRITFTFVYDG